MWYACTNHLIVGRGKVTGARKKLCCAFFNICGNFTTVKNRLKITDSIKKGDHKYFGIKRGEQNKTWARHIVCSNCLSCVCCSYGLKRPHPYYVLLLWVIHEVNPNNFFFKLNTKLFLYFKVRLFPKNLK